MIHCAARLRDSGSESPGGCECVVAAHDQFRHLVEEARLIFASVQGDPSGGRGGPPLPASESEKLWQAQLKAYERAAEGAGCIVPNWFGVIALHLGQVRKALHASCGSQR